MKFIGRILWLVLGLLWRLVVLGLFEKWIPFPDQPKVAPAKEPRRARKKKKEPKQQRRAEPLVTPPSPFERERALRAEQRRADKVLAPFFAAQSSELSPELAAQREGEHWLAVRAPASRAPKARTRRESLAGLLRDKHALRDAVVLGAALSARRTKL